jgi:excisionase family DNA binding protein
MSKNTNFLFENSEITEDSRSISTAQAAKMLGMSTTLMQKLVDQKEFKAWKTPGGHRRIDLSSIHAYQGRLQFRDVPRVKKPSLPVIKIIVDDPSISTGLKRELNQWSQSFEISLWDSMPEAFLSFANQLPDILIVQMSVPLQQQLSTVSAVSNFLQRAPKPFSVVCLSDAPELSTKIHEDLSSSIQMLSQPLTRAWLKAFLMGVNAGIRNSATLTFGQ